MEIQLYKPNQLANLPKSELEISSALDSRMIKDIEDVYLFELFKSGLTKAYALVRWDCPEGQEFQIMIDQVMKISKSKHGTLRENELDIALTRGVLREYGDYMGLSIVTFVTFIKSYMIEEARLKLVAAKNKPIEDKKEPTAAEQGKAFIDRLEILYNDHRSGKAIMPTEAAFYFDKLYQAKIIRFTKDLRDQLKQKAFERLIDLKKPSKSNTPIEYRKLKSVYENFLKDGTEGTDVKREAMYLGLMEWFDQLYEFEISIRDEVLIIEP